MSTTPLTPSAEMSTAAGPPPEKNLKETLQQLHKSADDLPIGPVRRKRMPAGRHAVIVSPPPAKAEARVQQGEEARKE